MESLHGESSRSGGASLLALNEVEMDLERKWRSPTADLSALEWYALSSAFQRRTHNGAAPPVEVLKAAKRQSDLFGPTETMTWLAWRMSHPPQCPVSIAGWPSYPSPTQDISKGTPIESVGDGKASSDKVLVKKEFQRVSDLKEAESSSQLGETSQGSRKRTVASEPSRMPPTKMPRSISPRKDGEVAGGSSTSNTNAPLHTHKDAIPRATPTSSSSVSSAALASASASSSIPQEAPLATSPQEEVSDVPSDKSSSKQHSSSTAPGYTLLDSDVLFMWHDAKAKFTHEDWRDLQKKISQVIHHTPPIPFLKRCRKDAPQQARCGPVDSMEWIKWRWGHFIEQRGEELSKEHRPEKLENLREFFNLVADLDLSSCGSMLMTVLETLPAELTHVLNDSLGGKEEEMDDLWNEFLYPEG